MLNEQQANFWQKVTVGQIIELKDQQTIEYLMNQGLGIQEHGADFEVTRERRIKSQDGLIEWLLFDIKCEEIQWYLIVKVVGDDFDVKIYEPFDSTCEEGDRNDLLDQEFDYIFEASDSEDFNLYDLGYVKYFEIYGPKEEEITYEQDGLFFGTCVEGNTEDFATVVEYTSDVECENPDIFILEANAVDEDEKINNQASIITFLQGCEVNLNEIEVMDKL